VYSLAIAGLLGYLIGSIPTAYLLVKWKSRVDIRQSGSGNVGTLNSLQVSKSRLIGVSVLALDLLKGIVAVLLAKSISGEEFSAVATAGVAAVVGHNFPVWLSFKGGRGLATAAGVVFLVAWPIVAIWGLCWALGFRATKDVNVGNAVACLMTMILVLAAPSFVAGIVPDDTPMPAFSYFMTVLFGVILVKHVQPFREFVLSQKRK